MAVVIRSKGRTSGGTTPRKIAAPQTVDVKLPTEYAEAGGELNDFSILIHGVKKIGKTSLALQGGRVLVLQFDPPQRAYRRLEVVCDSWRTFQSALKQLKALADRGKFPYDRVVIDRADMWYKYCEYYVMEKLAIKKMSEEPFGGAWAEAEKTFTDAVDQVLRLPCGKWFLCHSVHEGEENRHGEEIIKLKPNLSKRADAVLNGKCDAWFAYTFEGKKRALVVKGDERTGAGHRIDGHFRTPDGQAIDLVSMGTSAEKGYANLLAAFNNEQKDVNPLESSSGQKGDRVKVKTKR